MRWIAVIRSKGTRPPGGQYAAARDGSDDGWLHRLFACYWQHRTLTVITFVASPLTAILTAAVPLIQRDIIDNAILRHTQPIWTGATLLLLTAMLGFGLLSLRLYRGGQLSLDIQHDLRTEMFDSLTKFDGVRQDQIHTGQIVSRSISDLNALQSLLAVIPMMIGNGLLFALSLVAMLVLSPLLALVSLAVGPALLVLSMASKRRLFPATWDAQQKVGDVAGVVEAAVAGVRVVKGFGQEEQEVRRLENVGRVLYAARVRSVRLAARYAPALGAIPLLGQVGVLALGGWMAIEGDITLGTFLAFSSYLALMVGPVRVLTNLITFAQEIRASVSRVFEVIDSRPIIVEKSDALTLPPGGKDIELDDVHFGYVPSEPVLRGLSVRLRPGETLAIVGTSGSGKSTISLLLCRFYDVHSGAIRIAGHNIQDVTIDSLRASVGLVMEENFLFSGTIRDNIAFGRPQATMEQIAAAARAAEAEEFILGLPDGWGTVVGEQGLALSGGQRQRVALARALITDPDILVLDDATSAIDAQVEAQIHATLRKVTAGRTTMLIAHRRSTLELADRIAVLDEGRLVDEGTHRELVRRCAYYRMLLAGPGEDVEGVDAGELSQYQNQVDQRRKDHLVMAAGVTPGLWRADSRVTGGDDGSSAAVDGRRAERSGGAVGDSWQAGVSASPDLIARVAALPPAHEEPVVDELSARAPDPQFTLRKLLMPFAIALVIGMVLDGLDAVANAVLPLLVRGGIDNGVERQLLSVQARFDIILGVSGIGLAIVLADWSVNWVQAIVVGRNGERLVYALRLKIFAHLQRLGLDFYEREPSGRIMTWMTSDVDSLSSFFQTGLITMVNSLCTFLVVLTLMLIINVRLGLILCAVLPFLIAATVVFRKKSSSAYAEGREKIGIVNADLQENVAGLRVAQAYRRERVNSERFASLSWGYRNARLRAQRATALYFPFIQALSTIGGALVLFAGASEVRSGVITVGSLLAYLLWVDSLFSPVQQLSQVYGDYQQANAGLQRIKDFLRTPTSTPSIARPIRPGRLRGEIELRDVRFGYPGKRAEAIAGISLSVAPGETIALVGQTGAGKSTLVKLVARFYDVRSGSVLIDGIDVREYDLVSILHQCPKALRSHINPMLIDPLKALRTSPRLPSGRPACRYLMRRGP